MKKADIIAGLIGTLIGIYAIWDGMQMPTDDVMNIGPSFFPMVIAGFLIFFSLFLLVNALKGKSKGSVTPFNFSDMGLKRGIITVVAGVIYCLLMDTLGFIPTSILFLIFMMWLLGERKTLLMFLVAPAITMAIWAVFEKILHLSMPVGILAGWL